MQTTKRIARSARLGCLALALFSALSAFSGEITIHDIGRNRDGWLPEPDDTDVVDLYGDVRASPVALRADGSLFTWKDGEIQELDHPPTAQLHYQSTNYFGALYQDGSFGAWRVSTSTGERQPVSEHIQFSNQLGPVVAVHTSDVGGDPQGIALRADGTVATWANDPTGIPPVDGPIIDVAWAGNFYALSHDGHITSWQKDGTLIDIEAPDDLVRLYAGGFHRLYGIRRDGGLWFTENAHPDYVPIETSMAARVRPAIDQDVCVVQADGSLVPGGGGFIFLIGFEDVQDPSPLDEIAALWESLYGGNDWLSCHIGVSAIFAVKAATPDELATGWLLPQSHQATAGEDIVFRAYVYGLRPWTLQWFHNGEEIPGANEETLVLHDVDLSAAGEYVLKITNPGGIVETNPSVIDIAKPRWTLTVNETHGGTVTIDPAQVDYLDGETVELTAIPDEGFALTDWVELGDGEPVQTVTMNGDLTLTPVFTDVAPPLVQVLAPAAGVTNNGKVNLIAQLGDNDALQSVRWIHDGTIHEIDVESLGDLLTVPDASLRPGDNVFRIEATDPTGLTGFQEVTVTWSPDQWLGLEPVAPLQFGGILCLLA